MSVYNGGAHLAQAIESVLCQAFRDFEFVIVNDGSMDGSTELLRSFARKDSRIVLLEQDNKGLNAALNRGLRASKGRYVARMDADDIAEHERLGILLQAFSQYPGVDVIGTGSLHFTEEGMQREDIPEELEHSEIKARLLFRNCISHPTVAMDRLRLAQSNMEYSSDFKDGEDYELWERLAHSGFVLRNIPDITVRYRLHATSLMATRGKQYQAAGKKIQQRALERMQFPFSEFQLCTHFSLRARNSDRSRTLADVVNWLELLAQVNARVKIYETKAFHDVIARELPTLSCWHHGLNIAGLRAMVASKHFSAKCWSVRDGVRLIRNYAASFVQR
jgi:glycosyltransferase involved in cell wall biosynthesis